MEELFHRFSGPVNSVAYRVLHDRAQAEDVMQETFLQLWQKPASFQNGRGSLGAWLVVVARNRAIDLLRRRKPINSVDEVVLASPLDLSAEAERNLMVSTVRRVVRDLPAEQRTPLELAYFEGLSHTEISIRTGVPLGTVKTRIRLALIRLRKALTFERYAGDLSRKACRIRDAGKSRVIDDLSVRSRGLKERAPAATRSFCSLSADEAFRNDTFRVTHQSY